MRILSLLPLVLVALVGCASGPGAGSSAAPPGSGAGSPGESSRTSSASASASVSASESLPTPPLSTVPPPTRATPVPPTTPSDLVEPRTVSGRVTRSGDCTYLTSDTGRLTLRDAPADLADGAQVELSVRPLPQLRDPCGEGLVQVLEVRPS